MAIFGFGKNKKNSKEQQDAVSSPVKVLGSGCASCNLLEEHTRQALLELGMDTSIEHVTDFVAIAGYGVMTTPALVVDGKLLASGKVLSKEEVLALLKDIRGKA
ncbi:MAG TPA: thioredoxin family protein [Sphaerochaeta sp.]|nr:thioredoxin family protein [Sphaerochaeta sp.]